MDRMIYLSMTGAKATMQRQDVLAHNLANASTPGFRAEMTAFRAVPVRGDGASTRVYALESTPGYNAEPGAGAAHRPQPRRGAEGQRLARGAGLDGTEAYTRAGALDLDAEGLLITKTGLAGARRRRADHDPANAQVQIAPDGTVSAAVGNDKPQPVGKLKLVTPEAPLQRGEDGLFRAPDGDLPADPNARLQDGALEGSNVSAVETMIAMIAAARQFEQQMKMVQSARGERAGGDQAAVSNG